MNRKHETPPTASARTPDELQKDQEARLSAKKAAEAQKARSQEHKAEHSSPQMPGERQRG